MNPQEHRFMHTPNRRTALALALGALSAIGASTNAASNLIVDGGVLMR